MRTKLCRRRPRRRVPAPVRRRRLEVSGAGAGAGAGTGTGAGDVYARPRHVGPRGAVRERNGRGDAGDAEAAHLLRAAESYGHRRPTPSRRHRRWQTARDKTGAALDRCRDPTPSMSFSPSGDMYAAPAPAYTPGRTPGTPGVQMGRDQTTPGAWRRRRRRWRTHARRRRDANSVHGRSTLDRRVWRLLRRAAPCLYARSYSPARRASGGVTICPAARRRRRPRSQTGASFGASDFKRVPMALPATPGDAHAVHGVLAGQNAGRRRRPQLPRKAQDDSHGGFG